MSPLNTLFLADEFKRIPKEGNTENTDGGGKQATLCGQGPGFETEAENQSCEHGRPEFSGYALDPAHGDVSEPDAQENSQCSCEPDKINFRTHGQFQPPLECFLLGCVAGYRGRH